MCEIMPVLPPSDEELDFEHLDCSPNGEISVVDDNELSLEGNAPVIEVLGFDSNIVFFVNCRQPYLVIHFKSIDRFFSLSVTLRDSIGKDRKFEISNKRSVIAVDKDMCKLPLEVGPGWQRVCVDLNNLVLKAFGSSFVICSSVVINGSCRISKLFFQKEDYSDIELPSFLRVCVKA